VPGAFVSIAHLFALNQMSDPHFAESQAKSISISLRLHQRQPEPVGLRHVQCADGRAALLQANLKRQDSAIAIRAADPEFDFRSAHTRGREDRRSDRNGKSGQAYHLRTSSNVKVGRGNRRTLLTR